MGAATVTIKAIGDPRFVVSDAALITGHTDCATNVGVTSQTTRIFTCTSGDDTYVTSRVIALHVAANPTASVCELAVYTEQGEMYSLVCYREISITCHDFLLAEIGWMVNVAAYGVGCVWYNMKTTPSLTWQ